MSNSYDKEEVSDREIVTPTPFILKEDEKTGKKIDFISNVVDEKTLRRVQKSVLHDLANILINSFGPHGSVTCIKKLNALNMYTKDGHTILENVYYNGIIEQAIKDDIETITLQIAKTVGDGTTSAVLLSDYIFDVLSEQISKHNITAADITRSMDRIGKELDGIIRKSAKEATLQDIYDIAYVSSNGDPWVAQLLYSIYDTNGMGVFVDVAPTTAETTSVKMYDGMTIDSGFMDSCFITDSENNAATVDHPEVYFFDDPIDTKEIGVFLDAILHRNIILPYKNNDMGSMIPTIIVCPKISRDMSSLIDVLITIQGRLPGGSKLPINFVLNRTQVDQIGDIAKLCGAKPIFKYIDADVYKNEVEAGRAPTPETVFNWAGSCESVSSNSSMTKFIHPSLMKDEDGNPTQVYSNILSFVEAEIKKNSEDGGDARELGVLKRRLHSLKSNLVEVRVGGMTVADRDALLHLVEDSVKNCRSAAENGVGWGANFSGMLAIQQLITEYHMHDCSESDSLVVYCICEAYKTLIENLYATCMTMNEAHDYLKQSLFNKEPFNIRTKAFDGLVKSSIESDTIILNSVMKIIGMMVTCNQFMTPSAQHNVYSLPKEVE